MTCTSHIYATSFKVLKRVSLGEVKDDISKRGFSIFVDTSKRNVMKKRKISMMEKVDSLKFAWRLDQLEHVAGPSMSRMYQHSVVSVLCIGKQG